MNLYKDAHKKMFSSYILWKNILEKAFAGGITHFLVLVKNILNVLSHTKIVQSRIFLLESSKKNNNFLLSIIFQKVL